MKIVLISGLSGSGKSVALNLLEDHGFYCVDNLPLELIPDLVRYHNAGCLQTRQLGISLDIRSRPNTDTAVRLIERLRADGHEVDVLFLEADNDALLRRFAETRRSHPLAHERAGSLQKRYYRRKPFPFFSFTARSAKRMDKTLA